MTAIATRLPTWVHRPFFLFRKLVPKPDETVLETSKKRLRSKVEILLKDLQPLAKHPEKIEDLVLFFQITRDFVESLNKYEQRVASQTLKQFISNVTNDKWNKTPDGYQVSAEYICIPPQGLHALDRRELLKLSDLIRPVSPGSTQHYMESTPLDRQTYKEFYFENSVKSFMENNYRILAYIFTQELGGVIK